MRIALINQPWNTCPPVAGGSIAIWTHEVAQRLAASHEVVVYSRKLPSQSGFERLGGVDYVRYSTAVDGWIERLAGGPGRFTARSYYLPYLLRVARDAGRRRCERIHLHNFAQWVPILKRRVPTATTVLHMHSEWLSQLPLDVVGPGVEATDVIAGCSDYIVGLVRERFPARSERCVTLPNGVDLRQFNAAANVKPEPGKFLFVGRLSPEKGVHVLLDAFRIVAGRHAGATLEIVGKYARTSREFLVDLSTDPRVRDLAPLYSGDYRRYLLARLDGPLATRVAFTDHVPHAELPLRYRSAWALVNPSLSESFGMALIESMACGTPVVAAHTGGMVEITARGGGLTVEPGNAEALAGAMLDLLERPERRCELAGEAAGVARRFSWERVAQAVSEAHQGACGV